MSDKPINDGGPAFPESCNGQIIPGMRLRDWLAEQALAGILAWSDRGQSVTPEGAGPMAYKAADAMLAAREKPPC